jgi:hypothetical protein
MPSLQERLTAAFSSFSTDNPRILDEIDALYAPHMRFVDPLQEVEGRANFRLVNERLLSRSASLRVEGFSLVGAEPFLMGTWTMIARPKIGPQLTIAGASEFRTEGGLVVYQRDYWDILGTVMSGFPMIEPIYKKVIALLG